MSLEDLAAVKKQINDLKKEAKKKVKEVFHDAAKQLFVDNPELKSIHFTAYTPYFNDGDTCEFSSGHEYATINGVGDDADMDDEDYEKKEAEWDALDEKTQKKLQKAVKAFMKHWDDDDIYDLFGDHVAVTITAKGIKTEEYDHE